MLLGIKTNCYQDLWPLEPYVHFGCLGGPIAPNLNTSP